MLCFREFSTGRWRLLLPLLLTFHRGICEDLQVMSRQQNRCTYDRAYGKYGADCRNLQLTAVPKYVNTSIQILDMAQNNIRTLLNDSFDCCTEIRYLFLDHNKIVIIEEGTFTSLIFVHMLHLSNNALASLPNSIFHLPSLNTLLLSGNNLIHWDMTLLTLQKPIKAPLKVLDISHCRLKELPDLGFLPALIKYNVSRNPLRKISPEAFAKTCNFELAVLSGSLNKINGCDIISTMLWLNRQNVKYIANDFLKTTNVVCPEPNYGRSDQLQKYCRESAVPVAPEYRRNPEEHFWHAIESLFVFFVGFVLLLYVLHRWDVSRMMKRERQAAEAHAEIGIEIKRLDV